MNCVCVYIYILLTGTGYVIYGPICGSVGGNDGETVQRNLCPSKTTKTVQRNFGFFWV